ncbi:MAG: hypothetical protein AAFO81_14510 [Pseudomonadota bacterium]
MRTDLRLIVFVFLTLLAGCTRTPGLAAFTSDGCSLFPDSSVISSSDWCECCFEHDIAYWRGGTADQRKAADAQLKQCVADKTGNTALAALMYEGVRVGGSPYFYNWYRWGYGWKFERKYQALTPAEVRQSEQLLADYRASDAKPVCAGPVATPKLDVEP